MKSMNHSELGQLGQTSIPEGTRPAYTLEPQKPSDPVLPINPLTPEQKTEEALKVDSRHQTIESPRRGDATTLREEYRRNRENGTLGKPPRLTRKLDS